MKDEFDVNHICWSCPEFNIDYLACPRTMPENYPQNGEAETMIQHIYRNIYGEYLSTIDDCPRVRQFKLEQYQALRSKKQVTIHNFFDSPNLELF